MFASLAIPFDQNLVFALVFIGVVVLASGYAYNAGRSLLWWLRAEALIVAGAICYLSYVILEPYPSSASRIHTVAEDEAKLTLPAYDYSIWKGVPVQVEGRTKPFDTAARETLRHVTGREKFDGQEAVPVVLQWLLAPRGARGDDFTDWERKAFILCDHQDLRKEIFAHLPEEDQSEKLPGKYVSPDDVKNSPGMKKLLASAADKRRADREKASQHMTPAERKAEEVEGRLGEFLGISQVDARAYTNQPHVRDPFHFVILDRVPTGDWFSLGELRDLQNDNRNGVWQALMFERMAQRPQLYLDKNPQLLEALQKLQQQLKSGEGQKAVDELSAALGAQREEKLQKFASLQKAGEAEDATRFLLMEIAKSREEIDRVMRLVHQGSKGNREPSRDALFKEARSILADRDNSLLADLKARIAGAMQSGYRPDNPEFRMLHLDYLEALYPNFYRDTLAAQSYPKPEADRVLAGHDALVQAYRSGDADQFAQGSTSFTGSLQEVSSQYSPYPGEDTVGARLLGIFRGRPAANPNAELLGLELEFNKSRPFMWAWVLMFGSALCFIASLVLRSRVAYGLGFAAYLASLGYQLFGFYARVSISGRPPVTNMYETVVWVAFMSAVFALILESIYRRRVIALAGALVATLGLVLADQLPLALDPKINPIVPVLRSNYWLTVHVLTIVSSYAGGTLAWGLGNIALAMLAFGTPQRETLKTLSQYTYRAMQIAVLLLAAGTFLGGWWAAESWGRFWGWDPKEVWALIALVCYVIPLHARFIGWVKDFGLAVAAVLCYAAIVMSWYGVNFVLGAGLHSYGFGGGGPWWVFLAGLLNIEWVLVASIIYLNKIGPRTPKPEDVDELVNV